jgi:hypothetical protein
MVRNVEYLSVVPPNAGGKALCPLCKVSKKSMETVFREEAEAVIVRLTLSPSVFSVLSVMLKYTVKCPVSLNTRERIYDVSNERGLSIGPFLVDHSPLRDNPGRGSVINPIYCTLIPA